MWPKEFVRNRNIINFFEDAHGSARKTGVCRVLCSDFGVYEIYRRSMIAAKESFDALLPCAHAQMRGLMGHYEFDE